MVKMGEREKYFKQLPQVQFCKGLALTSRESLWNDELGVCNEMITISAPGSSAMTQGSIQVFPIYYIDMTLLHNW